MRYRKKLSKKRSKRLFRRTRGYKSINRTRSSAKLLKRGGYRL